MGSEPNVKPGAQPLHDRYSRYTHLRTHCKLCNHKDVFGSPKAGSPGTCDDYGGANLSPIHNCEPVRTVGMVWEFVRIVCALLWELLRIVCEFVNSLRICVNLCANSLRIVCESVRILRIQCESWGIVRPLVTTHITSASHHLQYIQMYMSRVDMYSTMCHLCLICTHLSRSVSLLYQPCPWSASRGSPLSQYRLF